MVATTFNVHVDTFEKIISIAGHLEKSQRDIIMMLLMRIMNDHNEWMGGFTAVKYQPDEDPEKWNCFHFRFKPDEYEFCVDLRKLCKCSVSLLIALAAERYYEELLDIRENFVDKYPKFSDYVLHCELIDDVICWHLYWGYPEKHLKNLLPIENRENQFHEL